MKLQSRSAQRAPDGWGSARFFELVLSDGSFPSCELVLLAAGKRSRWAATY
jgi:hypothetical protein